jgi:TonB family protein
MIFVLVSPLRAAADVVELKTGETIQGVLKEVNGTKVVIEVGGQSIAFERAKVKAFYVGTPPATPSGKVTTNRPGPAADAIQALKGLHSVTNSPGLTYDQYTARLLDAKVIVDRYLDQAPPNDAGRQSITDAMHLYALGSSALETNRRNRRIGFGTEVTDIGPDKTFEACPRAQEFMQNHKLKDGVTVLWTMEVMPAIWWCAGAKVKEAEKAFQGDASYRAVGAAPATAGGTQAEASTVTEDAIAALKALQSTLSDGLSHRDYGDRLWDAKMRVDRAVESQSAPPSAKLFLGQAIAYYLLADEAWETKAKLIKLTMIKRNERTIALIDGCPAARQFMLEYAEEKYEGTYYVIGERKPRHGSNNGERVADMSLQVLWGCASAKIMGAETALRVEADSTTGPASQRVVSAPPPSSTKVPTPPQTTPPTPGATTPGASQVVGTIGITMAMGSEPTLTYLGQIKNALRGKWFPPTDDLRRNLVAVVMVTLDRDGRIKGAMLEKTSGSTKFDEVAVRAVIDAQRGPALPRDRPEESVVVRATFSR